MLTILRIFLWGSNGQRCANSVRWVEAARYFGRIVDLLENSPRTSAFLGIPIRSARCDFGVALINSGDLHAGIDQLRLVVRETGSSNHPVQILRAYLALCDALASIGDYQAAEEIYDAGAGFAKSQGITPGEVLPGIIWSPEVCLARLRYAQGELQPAAELCSSVLSAAHSDSSRLRDCESLAMASQILGMTQRDVGLLDKAEASLAAAVAGHGGVKSLGYYEALLEQGRLRLAQRRVDEADRLFTRVRVDLDGKVLASHPLQIRAKAWPGAKESQCHQIGSPTF
jgi:tetratricopeptide (TPR) repeat protein